jgi:quercetin dioxygenase-like cupin family protein
MDKAMFDQAIMDGMVAAGTQRREVAGVEWKAHPAFTGVEMKLLLSGADTAGGYSLHLVRVAGGREIGEHTHQGSRELHTVVAGQGRCQTPTGDTGYAPGTCRDIPAGEPHRVLAGPGGLMLLATFVPALV